MKVFYENKLRIKWITYSYIVFFIISFCLFLLEPLNFKIWLCLIFFLFNVIAGIKQLNSTCPYMTITPEFLKIHHILIPWNKIHSIVIRSPLSYKFNTQFIIETDSKKYEVPWGTFSTQTRDDICTEIEKYKSIKFIHCTKASLNAANPTNAFNIWILLLIITLLVMGCLYVFGS